MMGRGQQFDIQTGRTFLEDSAAAIAVAAALFGALTPFATHAVRFFERVERAAGRSAYTPSEDDDTAEVYVLVADLRRALDASLAYYLFAHGWTYESLTEGHEGQEAAVWKGHAGEQFVVLTDGVLAPLISCELRAHLLQLVSEGRTPGKQVDATA